MLEAMRRNSRGTIIYVLFGILIAVFIINFGPGSQGCGAGMGSSYAAVVSGVHVSEPEFRLYYIAMVGNRFDARVARQYRMKEILMDKVIERELLAQQAEKLGFRVSTKEVEDLLKTGKMVLLAREDSWGDVSDGFEYKRFRGYIENVLGVSVSKFIEIQQREMLAQKMREVIAGTIKVSPTEALDAYEGRERQANLEFVRFAPQKFEGEVEVTPDDVAAYRKAHADELKKTYEERAFLYKKLEKQAKVRHILVAVEKDEKDQAKVDQARRKAERAKARLQGAGAADFAKVAKDVSDDEATKARGGDMGWHKKGFTGLGDELDGKIFEAKAGDVIGPVRGDKGFEIVKVDSFREGDVPFEQVAAELAEEKLRTDRANEKAKAAAAAAIAQAKESGQTLAQLFPKKGEEGGEDAAKKDDEPPKTEKKAEDRKDEKAKKPAVSVEETGVFPRKNELVPQIGVSKEIVQKAFDLKQGEIAGPFDVSGTWVVVQVKERREPDKEWFEKHKTDEMRALERMKWADVVDSWTRQECTKTAADNRINVNKEVLSYEGGGETPYTPCATDRM